MKIVTIPYSFDNYGYLILCEETGEAAVVDPGEYYPVATELERQGARLRQVFCTHHHADHISGLAELLDEYPELQVFGHTLDKDRIPGLTSLLNHGDLVKVGKHSGMVLYTPGHTRGSVCYQFDGAVITGDTMFGGGCGRLFEGSAEQMYQALNVVLKAYPPETKIYFAHEYTVQNLKFAAFVEPGNTAVQKRAEDAAEALRENRVTTPSTLGLELATNPFLRCEAPEIVQNYSETSAGPLEVFTALRKLKDNF